MDGNGDFYNDFPSFKVLNEKLAVVKSILKRK